MTEEGAAAAPTTPEFRPHPVPPALDGAVRAIWSLRATPARRFERILPQPAAHVIVNLSDPYRVVKQGSRDVDDTVTGVFVSVLQREHIVSENPAMLWNCVAELTPYGVSAFADRPPRELAGAVTTAEVIPGSASWRDDLRAAGDSASALLAERLVGALRPGWHPDPLARAACSLLDDDPDLPIGQLASDLGVPHGRLLTAFRAACGVTPKAYADLVRFHRFITGLPVGGGALRWSELAVAHGYYDQPHFIRSFRRFVGCTPTEYLAAVRDHGSDYALFVPMDEP